MKKLLAVGLMAIGKEMSGQSSGEIRREKYMMVAKVPLSFISLSVVLQYPVAALSLVIRLRKSLLNVTDTFSTKFKTKLN